MTRLRHKLFAAFAALSLLIVIVFGSVAYRIASDAAAAKETHLLSATVRERARHISADLTSLPSLKRWNQALSRYHGDDYVSVVGNQRGVVASSRPLKDFIGPTHLDFPFGRLFADPTGHGALEFGGVRYVWASAPVPGTDQRLLHLYRSKEHLAGPLGSVSARLAATALILFWIAAWLGLLFSSSVSRRLEARTAQLLHQTLHDELTGLPNRAQLRERLERLLTAVGGPPAVGLLVIDLRRFKKINDALGQRFGDRLLCAVSTRLGAAVADVALLARLGSDRFALLLDQADADQALLVAERVRLALADPFALDQQQLSLEASIGIALAPDHGEEADTLLQHAEAALLQAKREASDHSFFTPDESGHDEECLALAGELRKALETDALSLQFQPKRRLSDGTLYAVEALLRWEHPTYGMLLPEQLVPLAEHAGLLRPLTAWVLRQALLHCARFRRHGHSLDMAVNLAPGDLRDGELAPMVNEMLKRFAVAPEQLTLEVTEAALAADPKRAAENLHQLAALGVNLAIDDFGTGYTSLAELQRLPMTELKIDGRFVAAMTRDPDSAAIVRGALSLGHSLGLQVVAEGVEDDETRQRLEALGCDAAQGLQLGEPLPPETLLAALKRRSAAG